MALTLTAANAIFQLTIDNLFSTPQQLHGFAADDVFTTDLVTPVETLMGVDGVLSGGWVAQAKVMHISLQADSASVSVFDSWYMAQETAREVYLANGLVTLSSIGRHYTLLRGFLTNYPVIADARRILQPRRFQITWGAVNGAPTGSAVATLGPALSA